MLHPSELAFRIVADTINQKNQEEESIDEYYIIYNIFIYIVRVYPVVYEDAHLYQYSISIKK